MRIFSLITMLLHSILAQNSTIFVCDGSQKMISSSMINDNFCDCEDGTDETSTNACENGKFICKNRFHIEKIIPTSRLNDGVCDCCDGSDEIKKNNCPNTCLQLLRKEHNKDKETLENAISIISSYDKTTFTPYFESQIKVLKDIFRITNDLLELYKQLNIIKSYQETLKSNMGNDAYERNDFSLDDNDIMLIDVKDTLYSLNLKIHSQEANLGRYVITISNFMKFSVFQDMEENCFDSSYKSYEVKICLFKSIEYRGHKDNRYKTKNIGTFEKFEDNVFYFKNGANCGLYNRSTSGKLIMECGDENKLTFHRKNECEYEFYYKTKLGCNSFYLKNLRKRMSLYFKHIIN